MDNPAFIIGDDESLRSVESAQDTPHSSHSAASDQTAVVDETPVVFQFPPSAKPSSVDPRATSVTVQPSSVGVTHSTSISSMSQVSPISPTMGFSPTVPMSPSMKVVSPMTPLASRRRKISPAPRLAYGPTICESPRLVHRVVPNSHVPLQDDTKSLASLASLPRCKSSDSLAANAKVLGNFSGGSVHSLTDTVAEPTSPKAKKEWFKYSASENISVVYAIFLVMLGAVIYTADVFQGDKAIVAETFNIFLIIVQVLWIMYVHIDARVYLWKISKKMKEAAKREAQKQEEGDKSEQPPSTPDDIPFHYGFSSGKHSGSIYLKIGATVFCFGHMIHTGLNLAQKVVYLEENNGKCTNTADIIMSVLQPVWAFYQLFFIFKYSNLIINRREILSRFGLMHCIASSLCFWMYSIIQETLQSVFMKPPTNVTLPLVPHLQNIPMEEDPQWQVQYGCKQSNYMTDLINQATPYLYPFSIEFYILMAGFWMFLKDNMGKLERHTHIPSVEVKYEGEQSSSLTSNLVIFVDCHSSNRGLFLGLLMTVVVVISIILLFILSPYSNDDTSVLIGQYVNGITEVALHLVMVVAVMVAHRLILALDIVKHTDSSVDDTLLYVSLPCIFLYAFLRLVPSLIYRDLLFGSMAVLQVVQVVLQTALLFDGMRRCSNSQAVKHKKPGREVVTFLIVTNVALWLLQTFEVKTVGSNAAMYKFYGKEVWTLLSHLTLPFALFYRFHSSGCLAEIWMLAYEEDTGH